MDHPLSTTRAADRKVMAARLADLVREKGFAAEVHAENADSYRPRAVQVAIRAARGLRLTVNFDGDSQQQKGGVFVLSWHFESRSDARLSTEHWGVNVNPYHRQKATDVAHDYEGLLRIVESRLTAVADGRAFA